MDFNIRDQTLNCQTGKKNLHSSKGGDWYVLAYNLQGEVSKLTEMKKKDGHLPQGKRGQRSIYLKYLITFSKDINAWVRNEFDDLNTSLVFYKVTQNLAEIEMMEVLELKSNCHE